MNEQRQKQGRNMEIPCCADAGPDPDFIACSCGQCNDGGCSACMVMCCMAALCNGHKCAVCRTNASRVDGLYASDDDDEKDATPVVHQQHSKDKVEHWLLDEVKHDRGVCIENTLAPLMTTMFLSHVDQSLDVSTPVSATRSMVAWGKWIKLAVELEAKTPLHKDIDNEAKGR